MCSDSNENIPRADMVCRSVDKVHEQIAASPYPHMPLIFSEYNASYANLPNVTDIVSTWGRGWPTLSASAPAKSRS